MSARAALSMPHAIYAWVLEHSDDCSAVLWEEVKDEIAAIACMSIYFFTYLPAGWRTRAFTSDASSWVCGFVAARAALDELRE